MKVSVLKRICYSSIIFDFLIKYLGFFAIIPAIFIPVYPLIYPFIDKYLFDQFDNKYNWVFIVMSSTFTALLAYLSSNESSKLREELNYVKNKLKEHDNQFVEQRNQNKEYDDRFVEQRNQIKECKDQIGRVDLTDYNANHFTQFAMNIVNDSSDE